MLFVLCAGGSPAAVNDVETLGELHRQLLEAHLSNDVESWMALEADTMISANDGVVAYATAAERRATYPIVAPDRLRGDRLALVMRRNDEPPA